jgi:hypothetical protein
MRSSWRRRRDRAGLAVGTMLLLLAGVGVVQGGDRTGFTAAGTVPTTAAPTTAAPTTAAPRRSEPPGSAPAPRRTGIAAKGIRPDSSFAPDRVRVAALGVDAPVVREEVDGRGELSLPQDPGTVGWWGAGAAPGAPVGTIVLAGHVDSEQQGAGALYPLARTPVGARVVVSGPTGDATYVVQGRRRYAKDALPWRDLFRQDVEARLLLVTCGGDFDRATRHYSDNVVVYAVPLAASSPPSPR